MVMQLTHTACIHPSILRVGGYPPSYLLNTLFSSALPVNKSTLSNSNAVYFTVNSIYHYMFCPTSSTAHKRKTEVQTERLRIIVPFSTHSLWVVIEEPGQEGHEVLGLWPPALKWVHITLDTVRVVGCTQSCFVHHTHGLHSGLLVSLFALYNPQVLPWLHTTQNLQKRKGGGGLCTHKSYIPGPQSWLHHPKMITIQL